MLFYRRWLNLKRNWNEIWQRARRRCRSKLEELCHLLNSFLAGEMKNDLKLLSVGRYTSIAYTYIYSCKVYIYSNFAGCIRGGASRSTPCLFDQWNELTCPVSRRHQRATIQVDKNSYGQIRIRAKLTFSCSRLPRMNIWRNTGLEIENVQAEANRLIEVKLKSGDR